jgi:hypothetical protein
MRVIKWALQLLPEGSRITNKDKEYNKQHVLS